MKRSYNRVARISTHASLGVDNRGKDPVVEILAPTRGLRSAHPSSDPLECHAECVGADGAIGANPGIAAAANTGHSTITVARMNEWGSQKYV